VNICNDGKGNIIFQHTIIKSKKQQLIAAFCFRGLCLPKQIKNPPTLKLTLALKLQRRRTVGDCGGEQGSRTPDLLHAMQAL
jgi:hypothetical protein